MSPLIQLHIVPATTQAIEQIQNFLIDAEAMSTIESYEKKDKSIEIFELIQQNQFYLVYLNESLWGCFAFRSLGYGAQLTSFYLSSTKQLPETNIVQRQHNLLLLWESIQRKALEASFSYLTVVSAPARQAWYETLGGKPSNVLHNQNDAVEYYLAVVDQPWINLLTAGLVCIKDHRLLLAFSKNKQAWYLPGGKIDAGENSQEALIREIEEELSFILQPERLSYLTHIVAPAYGEKKNILMQQDCYLYELAADVITIANEIGGIQYFTKEEYLQHQIPVPGVLKVFDFLFDRCLL